MVIRRDYTQEQVEAAHSVLLELMRLLGEYRDEIVLVGGWVPALILSEGEDKHIGSIDVDLAFKHDTLQEPAYQTIKGLLQSRGYVEGKQPFIFHRTVKVGDSIIEVEVDLLAGEYGGTGKRHRTQKIQDVRARKARGCELALEMATEVRIDGTLPGGGKDSAKVRVATIVPFICHEGHGTAWTRQRKGRLGHLLLHKKLPGRSGSIGTRVPTTYWSWSGPGRSAEDCREIRITRSYWPKICC